MLALVVSEWTRQLTRGLRAQLVTTQSGMDHQVWRYLTRMQIATQISDGMKRRAKGAMCQVGFGMPIHHPMRKQTAIKITSGSMKRLVKIGERQMIDSLTLRGMPFWLAMRTIAPSNRIS